MKVKLGTKVRDNITGLEGIAIARCEYLNGCIQIQIQPQKLQENGKPVDDQWIDQQQIERVKDSKPVKTDEVKRGGPQRTPPRITP